MKDAMKDPVVVALSLFILLSLGFWLPLRILKNEEPKVSLNIHIHAPNTTEASGIYVAEQRNTNQTLRFEGENISIHINSQDIPELRPGESKEIAPP